MVSDCMLISILHVLVEHLEMSCAEASDALPLRAEDLNAEDLLSPLHLMCVSRSKVILNLVLPVSNFLRSLARLGLGQFP